MIKSCYIHIPFCSHICSYCDFCKVFYNEKLVDNYLDGLEKEINKYYRGDKLNTIYIGGGTPSSLSISQLKRLFDVLKVFSLEDDYEYTIECNVENITEEKLILFKENGINRISIGIESFNSNLLKFLERHYTKDDIYEKIDLVKNYFSNINVDLMYAIPGESLLDLENDIDEILKLGVSHISTYSLILEENTKLSILNTEYIDEELDLKMYQLIRDKLLNSGYLHYEISNFSLPGKESKHNLTYWKNLSYYGFGLGASGYIDSTRYTNTKSMRHYLEEKYRYEEQVIDSNLDRENQIMLNLRTLDGISKDVFFKKFGKNLEEFYDILWLKKENILLEDDNRYYINPEKWYILNEILVYFIGE